MKIRILADCGIETGRGALVLSRGDVVEVADQMGNDLVEMGYGEEVTGEERRAETAAMEPAERSVMSKGRRKSGL